MTYCMKTHWFLLVRQISCICRWFGNLSSKIKVRLEHKKKMSYYLICNWIIFVYLALFEYLLLSTDFLIIYGTEYHNKFAVYGVYHIIFESIPHALNVSSSFSSCQNLNFIHLKQPKITFILNSRFSGFWTL